MGRRLADIEHDLEFLARVGVQDRHTQRGPGQVAGIITAFGQRLQYRLIGDGDEVPGLGILGRLRPPPGVEDGEEDGFGQRFGGKFAHGALETDGIGNVHDYLLSRMIVNPCSLKCGSLIKRLD